MGGSNNVLDSLTKGLVLNPLPEHPAYDTSVPHAPGRPINLSENEKRLAIKNSLRYFPASLHQHLAPEFLEELNRYGHIYMYRFRPVNYEMKAYPIDQYPAKCKHAAAIMLMIMNNLDKEVAQFPHELITYGGNGSVFQNWAQYHLVMKYLSEMTDNQTLSMYSGHPMGLFPSKPSSPRVIVTNGMVIPNYSSRADYERMYALGVSQYGQMTAGSYCYIGPQGIVHGTTITLLNAGRKYMASDDLRGKLFVTSGLGGMSGAQAKAAVICGAVGIVAEVNIDAVNKRHAQGWVLEVYSDLDKLIERIKSAKQEKKPMSIAYHGNVVDLWEKLVASDVDVELGSDQTSLHNPYNGGYYPAEITFEEANTMMVKDPVKFKSLVESSLVRHADAINKLSKRGMKFWDYGNSFLLEASRAKADIFKPNSKEFRYPSYVQDIMGDIFSLGFGPFRWVCTSGNPADLQKTDDIAREIIEKLRAEDIPTNVHQQFNDNHLWITQAGEHKLVVGSQARILYSDALGRVELAVAFNKAVASGQLTAPVVISRDHHDVSGTDSPWRETSNVVDGSEFCADMAVQNFVGDAHRGATWISLHNGGGTGWGEAINGGFGMVLDGSQDSEERARMMLAWDVNNGIARRSWSYNDNAETTIQRAMKIEPLLKVTLPNHTSDETLKSIGL
ncbi:urocanate hydratase [Heterostelium album PN500]|uniref:urocanate hydratase n=1 Tax=Heterostelium pallidum (strain ATCC 26659 / Pp 5 / PN500) TaxID=670386 RepID=D3BI11_HETP5|nr:urocanate hydratase [Heterostelium album PN500]EFA78911.1 urocanate hydratase [Heterostelium album PN500]|eukprot:XP_020431035.1 urocanate hydratase [Heterostelium album PN500]